MTDENIKEEKMENTNSESETENKEDQAKKGGFKAWFNKTKGDVNNYLLENKIENTFNKNNQEFSLGTYNPDAIISSQKQIFGYFDNEGAFIIFGEKEIPSFSIMIDNETNLAYTIESKIGPTSVEVEVEGVKYVRPGTKFTVNNHVQEVKIIKVGGRIFLYEGK